MHLVEKGEVGAVGGGAELLDFAKGTGFLGAEVVAGEAQDGQALGAICVLQGLQARVLARKAAAAGHIHDQQHLAGPLAKAAFRTLGITYHHIAHIDGHGCRGWRTGAAGEI